MGLSTGCNSSNVRLTRRGSSEQVKQMGFFIFGVSAAFIISRVHALWMSAFDIWWY